MVIAVQLERYMAGACIFSIVISKLSYRLEPCSVIPFKIDKSSKVSLYSTISPLGLAVSLRIKGSWESLFNAKKVAEQWSELGVENWALVGHN